jgi:hypothetical protein
VTIPDSVTSIGEYVFYGCTGLTGVTIPASVTSIEWQAFSGCTGLTGVTIPDSVTSIGYGAFYGCTGLTGVTIPDSVTSIGEGAFEDCTGLTGVTIPASVTSIDYDAFFGCDGIREVTFNANLPSFQVGWVFSGSYQSWTNLVIGESVTEIGWSAFSGCAGLTEVTIPASVTNIDNYAFRDCAALSRVTILCDGEAFVQEYYRCWIDERGITHCERGMKEYVFDGCVNIRELVLEMPTVPQNFGSAFFKQGWYNYETGEYEINPNGPTVSTNAVSVIFGDSVTNIGERAFANTVGPTDIDFGSGPVTIGYEAFGQCVGLTNIVFGSGAVSIGGWAFGGCFGLTNIVFGSGTVSIGGWAFSACAGLTNIVFGSGAVSIGDRAFDQCVGLTNIVFGSGTVDIGSRAFSGCAGLTDVTIPDVVTNIGWAPFVGCSTLTNIGVVAAHPAYRDIGGVLYSEDAATLLQFPAGRAGEYAVSDGTACIGRYAFAGCDGLTGLSLPASVTNIGVVVEWNDYYLFGEVIPVANVGPLWVGISLTNINVAAENPVYRDIGGVLYDKNATTLLTYPTGRAGGYAVPPGVIRFSAGAFTGHPVLTDVTIPDSVTGIGSRSFYWCTGLTNIVFGSEAVEIEALAFAGCIGLTGVAIGNAVTNIGDGAFHQCYGLTTAVIPDSVAGIGYGAFGDCAKLTGVTLPGGVTHVGDWAFGGYGGGGLTSAVMSNVRVMGPSTFYGQPELAEVAFTAAEPPRIVEEWPEWSGEEYTNCFRDVGADWEFDTWQAEGDFTVLVPAAYLENWVADEADPVWRGRPVRTLESAWGIPRTFNFALDADRFDWSPDTTWFIQSGVRWKGAAALQSGAVGNNGTSSMQTAVKDGGTLVFRYRTSCEAGYDFLRFYVDGVQKLAATGENVEWRTAVIPVSGAGKHTLTWRYEKDAYDSEGEDCAWVDQVVWTPAGGGSASVATPAISPPDGTLFTTPSRRVVISCATEGAEIRFTTDGSDPTVSSPLYTGSFNIHATATVKARAFKSGMADSEIAVAVITKPVTITLADALDIPAWAVTAGGDASWTPQTSVSHDGADAARSGAIGLSQTTWMETAVSGAGTLTFWWRASCEDSPDDDWDYLAFSVDGTEQARIDGDSGWQQVSVTLAPGGHMLRWAYTKDGYDETVYEDCGWVDQVVWTPAGGGTTTTTGVPVPHAWLDALGLVTGGDYEAAALLDADGDGHAAWQEYVAGTCPTNAASVFTASVALSNGAPVVTWKPDMRPGRVYTVEGKAKLSDAAWTSPTNAASRFFRVKVGMPGE